MPPAIPTQDIKNELVNVLRKQAFRAPLIAGGAQGYFYNLIQKTNLPEKWKENRISALTGVAEYDARNLIEWALDQGGNTRNLDYHTLGSLLKYILPDVGHEDGRFLAAFILAFNLYRDAALQQELREDWYIPADALLFEEDIKRTPELDFNWEAEVEETELQAFFRPPLDILDFGFLQRAMPLAKGVCRLELTHMDRVGTAFMIAPTLALTNYHNINFTGNEDTSVNLAGLRLRFGVVTEASGSAAKGEKFKLVSKEPMVKFSPIHKLDYALLRVEDKITYMQSGEEPHVMTVPLSDQVPVRGDGLNILQHPGGETLKLAISADGIDKVIAERGLVQYSTRARGGSSGSPAFNDDWEVVAIHHAEKSRAFGSIREGILIRSILDEIQSFL